MKCVCWLYGLHINAYIIKTHIEH